MGRIIARTLLLLGVALVLVACSATRVAYNQAPNFAYWRIDGFVDFTDTQSPQARQELDRFFAWHRRAELPLYAERLAQWQALALKDITPEQACTEFEAVRDSLRRMTEQGLEPLTALALQLGPQQLEHLKRHQAKGDETFEKDFVRGSPAQRLDRRMDRAIDRYETLYGALNAGQRDLLQAGLQRSPWDPQRSFAERQRRQAALLQTIRDIQASHGAAFSSTANGARKPPPQAVAAVRTWSQRLLDSPTPGYAAYSASLVREGCAQFAQLHNSTSPEQRAHAVGVLKGYEADMRALVAQD
ncbi:DUF6279 family lipoprotein [Hydrogenophaga sp.]|uniref:DUF6279 family lipoprotein n=1 Tax=Hydrogenophaga sp. TaxID=1904254 RepID=UPI0025B9A378|nr:DUF6279 family lipoprotein [Hydrogenophaga sp.]